MSFMTDVLFALRSRAGDKLSPERVHRSQAAREIAKLAVRSYTPRAYCDSRVFFVAGPARSGTSATIRILAKGHNVACYEQKNPRFVKEVRQYKLGCFQDVAPLVLNARWPDILKALSANKLYGEKDQQVYPWLSKYWQLFGGRYVNVVKDGRDAVRSLMEFHQNVNGSLYLEAPQSVPMDPDTQAAAKAATRDAAIQTLEKHRPRPLLTDEAFFHWHRLSRIEMAAFYWSTVIRTAEKELVKFPEERSRRVDFTSTPSVTTFHDLYSFLGIEGFDAAKVERMLTSKINSVRSNVKSEKPPYPKWQDWSETDMKAFDGYAAAAMVENGYYPIEAYPFRLDIDAYERSIIRPWPFGETQAVIEAVYRNASIGPVRDNGEHLILAVNDIVPGFLQSNFPSGASFENWSGGELRTLPKRPRRTVHAVGILEASQDVERVLKQIAELTQKRLVIVNLLSPFIDSVDHQYLERNNSAPTNRLSFSKVRSLLLRALGFSKVSRLDVETEWVLNPWTQVIVAEK